MTVSRLRRWATESDHVPGVAMAVAYVLVLARTARHLGFARDEGFYFHAATDYAHWFELLFRDPHTAMTRAAVDGAWGYNHEHPALMKSLFALSWLFLHQRWHVIAKESLSFRLPGMVLAGVGLWLTNLYAARAYGRRAGILAAALLALMPRVFYHAHLACFDVPVMTLWIAVIYCYWRSLPGGVAWSLATGVVFGLALETKHNAWFLPFVVVAHYVVTRGGDLVAGIRRGSLPFPLALVAMAVCGPLIFFGLWPWMWFDTVARVNEYVGFHLHHAYYNMEFMGVNWFRPPFPLSYVWGMIGFTVPTTTLVLFFVGIASRARSLVGDTADLLAVIPKLPPRARAWLTAHRGDGTDALIFLGFIVPILPWLSHGTPIFGGTKHWFPAYPFLAIFAGAGFSSISYRFEAELRTSVRRAWLPSTALGALLVLPSLAQTTHAHPFGLTAYVPFIGGAPGAADIGLNRQFWGFTTGSLVPWFNHRVRPNGSVYIHDTTAESWAMLQTDGYLRADIHPAWEPSQADFSIVHHELHMNEVDYQIWTAYQSPAVTHVLTYDGVPVVSVYAHPGR